MTLANFRSILEVKFHLLNTDGMKVWKLSMTLSQKPFLDRVRDRREERKFLTSILKIIERHHNLFGMALNTFGTILITQFVVKTGDEWIYFLLER